MARGNVALLMVSFLFFAPRKISFHLFFSSVFAFFSLHNEGHSNNCKLSQKLSKICWFQKVPNVQENNSTKCSNNTIQNNSGTATACFTQCLKAARYYLPMNEAHLIPIYFALSQADQVLVPYMNLDKKEQQQ